MRTTPMKISLDVREDRYHQNFYIGWCASPIKLSLKKGVAFMIFLSEEGYEELHICNARPNSKFSSIKKSLNKDGVVDRYFVNLEKKIDDYDNPYYIGIIQDDDLEISLDDPGMVFMVFTSREGSEQIQIVQNKQAKEDVPDTDIKNAKYDVEYIVKSAVGHR